MPLVSNYSSCEVDQYDLSIRLLSLTQNNTNYTLTQVNGQRIFKKAPHVWSGPEPSRDCEVSSSVKIIIDFYVRRLVKDFYDYIILVTKTMMAL